MKNEDDRYSYNPPRLIQTVLYQLEWKTDFSLK